MNTHSSCFKVLKVAQNIDKMNAIYVLLISNFPMARPNLQILHLHARFIGQAGKI